MIGAVYDDCVGAGDVYPVLDDGGRNQHIILMLNEIEHYALHLLFVHLPVADDEARLRHQALDQGRNRLDRFDAIVDEKDLPAASQFELNCRLDHVFGKLNDLSLDCEPIARRSFDQRHVAQPAQRHVERARNWRRRQASARRLASSVFQSLFVGHAETLLFIDHDDAEFLKAARLSKAAGAFRSPRQPRRPRRAWRSPSAPSSIESARAIQPSRETARSALRKVS